MLEAAVGLGRLVEVVLRETVLSHRLAAAAGQPLHHDHVRWLAGLCMLGGLQAETPEAALLSVLVEALGPGRMGGRTATLRESDIKPLMSAIVSPGGLALD